MKDTDKSVAMAHLAGMMFGNTLPNMKPPKKREGKLHSPRLKKTKYKRDKKRGW